MNAARLRTHACISLPFSRSSSQALLSATSACNNRSQDLRFSTTTITDNTSALVDCKLRSELSYPSVHSVLKQPDIAGSSHMHAILAAKSWNSTHGKALTATHSISDIHEPKHERSSTCRPVSLLCCTADHSWALRAAAAAAPSCCALGSCPFRLPHQACCH